MHDVSVEEDVLGQSEAHDLLYSMITIFLHPKIPKQY